MVKLLLRCENCLHYSMKTPPGSEPNQEEENPDLLFRTCEHCGGQMRTPHPPRFSIENRYEGYLRRMKALADEESP